MPRHLARNKAGEQLVVSYMLMPNSTSHALVTKVDAVPLHIQRALISLLESPEAQRTEVLAEVLGRRTFADSGKNMFQVLHETNALSRLSIDEIVMTPAANAAIPLRQVLTALGRIPNQQQAQQQAQQGFNPHTHNQRAEAAGENIGIARNLLIEAEMMEADAHAKRERAYEMAPSLAPAPAPAPTPAKAPTEAKKSADAKKADDAAKSDDASN